MVLEAPTWRASRDWGAKLGYDAAALADANREAIELMLELRDAVRAPRSPMVISGNIGPRGDGYVPGLDERRSRRADYHARADRRLRRHRGRHGVRCSR